MSEKKDLAKVKALDNKTRKVVTAGKQKLDAAIGLYNAAAAGTQAFNDFVSDLAASESGAGVACIKTTDVEIAENAFLNSLCAEEKDKFFPKDKDGNVDAVKSATQIAKFLLDSALANKSFSDLLGCVDPYYNKFFNLVPIHFYLGTLLNKLLKSLLLDCETLDPKSLIGADGNPVCGVETIETLCNGIKLPSIDPITLPALPYIPVMDPLKILESILVEVLCVLIRCILDGIVREVAEAMQKFDVFFLESLSEDNKIPDLAKINLNKVITYQSLVAAKNELEFLKDADIGLFKLYFDNIHSNEKITQQEIILLIMNEEVCNIVDELVKIGLTEQFKSLNLDTNENIVEFFAYIASYVDIFKLINDSKDISCIPNPCLELDKKLESKVISQIEILCGLLNPDTSLPELPIEAILESVGVDKISKDSIKSLGDSFYNQSKNYLKVLFEEAPELEQSQIINITPFTFIHPAVRKDWHDSTIGANNSEDNQDIWDKYRFGLPRYGPATDHDGVVPSIEDIMSFKGAKLDDGGFDMFKQLKKEFATDNITLEKVSAKKKVKAPKKKAPKKKAPEKDSSYKCPEITKEDLKWALYFWGVCDSQDNPKKCLESLEKYSYMTHKPESENDLKKMQKDNTGCK